MNGYLIAEEGPLAGLIISFEEGDSWTLGRDPDDCSIILEDSMVSRKHAICSRTAEGFLLENSSSVNPVIQNGKVVEDSILLREGDILQIGSTFFRFTEKSPTLDRLTDEPSDAVEPLSLSDEEISSLNEKENASNRWMIKVIAGPGSGAEFYMQASSSYIVGKDPALCDILFQDMSVSRQHAKLELDENQNLFIEDLGSRNGVLVNGEMIAEKKQIASQDLITIGTTSFLAIDQEEVHETIYSPPTQTRAEEYESQEEELAASAPRQAKSRRAQEEQNWKQMRIPKRHLVGAAALASALLFGVIATLTLFQSETIEVEKRDYNKEISELLETHKDIQFVFNAPTGRLFIVGHVLTQIEREELLYKLQSEPYIRSIDDNIVVDELVRQNMNDLLASNPAWNTVSIVSLAPGKFALRGYMPDPQDAEALEDYINRNFPYTDKLSSQVAIESVLQLKIQNMLLEKGMNSVSFQLINGELLLSGILNSKQENELKHLIQDLKGLQGVRSVNNLVLLTSADTSIFDLSSKYSVMGYSKSGDNNIYVVINNKVLSKEDSLDGMLITDITANEVILEKDGLKFKINYNQQ